MCGIIGFISTHDKYLPGAKEHFLEYALMLDTLRGADSTGLILVRDEFDVTTAHTTASGMEYVQGDHYKDVVKEPAWAAVGHNRAATAGSVKLENAHPFTFGDVTLVHNGTLARRGASLPTFKPELEVDSMQLAWALSQSEPDDVPDVLKQVDGSFCVVWVDQRNDTINMARNSDRPMHFTFNDTKDIMWFMSDGDHLNCINKSMKRSTAHGKSIYQLDRHKWLRWKKGSLIPEVKPFSPFVAPVQKWSGLTGWDSNVTRVTGHAMHRAKERWASTLDSRQKNTTVIAPPVRTGTSEGKARIAGERRKIPAVHEEMLERFYELGIDTLLAMEVTSWTDLGGKKCIVEGTFEHPDWYGEWPVVLFDVPLVVCNAYPDNTWAVKVKGITQPISGYTDTPSILAELYSTDAKTVMDLSYFKDTEKDELKEDNNSMVVGPEDRLVEYGKLLTMIGDGCVQCGGGLSWERRRDYLYVNEGRDIMCDLCVEDLESMTA
jgi:hypothetical protein